MLQKLNREYDLRLVRLGTGLEPISTGSLAGLQPQDPGTRLLELLQASRARQRGAVRHHRLQRRHHQRRQEERWKAWRRCRCRYFAVGVGEAEGFTDVRIAKVGAPEFAFRGREFKIDLTIQASGMKGRIVPLFFNRGKNIVTTRASRHRQPTPSSRKSPSPSRPRSSAPMGFPSAFRPRPANRSPRTTRKSSKSTCSATRFAS